MPAKLRLISFVLAATLLASSQLSAQQITGRVTTSSGEPLAAVQVFIAGSGIGALTQNNGRFLLLNVPAGTHPVSAERIGYRSVTQQVTVAAGQTVVQDFQLSEEALGLDEIVVTGTPGGTQRRALGNAVASIAATSVLEKAAVNGVQDLLTGRVPGAQMRGITGSVGTGGSIQIRGQKTFNLGSNPLIFIDGVRMNNSTQLGPDLGDRAMASALDNINPADIQSIEIIKGPAAATLYGTEASAGVVQIITKRGAEGAPVFQASVRGGVQYLRNPAKRLFGFWSCTDSGGTGVCLPQDFTAPAGFVVPAPCTPTQTPGLGNCSTRTLFEYNPYDESNRLLDEGMWGPWPTDRVYSTGPSQSYNLSVTGGGQNVRYFLSGNFDKDRGADYYNTNDVYRLRSNTNVVFSEKLTADFSMGYSKGYTRFGNAIPNDGGSWDDYAWGNGGCIPGRATDHNPAVGAPQLDQYGRYNPCPRTLGFQQMLPTDVHQIDVNRDFNSFTGSATLNFTPAPWLATRAVIGLDKGWETNQTLFPLWVGVVGEGPGTCGIPEDLQNACATTNIPRQQEGELTYEKANSQYLSLDLGATAKFSFMGGNLGTATSAGLQYYDRYDDGFENIARGFASPLSTTVNQGTLPKAAINYSQTQNKSAGFYVQEELNWQQRIFVTGALRFDGNSAFGEALDPEIYPKVSATWTISDENFWNFDAVNSLRFRAAYGSSGRQPSTFARITRYRVTEGPVGTSAFEQSGSGNADVRPEVSTELEVGFDLALFDGRVSSEFTYFRSKTTDALLSVPQAPSFGRVGSIQANLGRIDNWGWEESLNIQAYQSDAIAFSLNLTGTHTDNMIMDIGSFPATSSTAVGYPIPSVNERYWITSSEYVPAGTPNSRVDLWGNRFVAMCDSGVRSTDGVGEEKAHGLVAGGEPVPCQLKDANTVMVGRGFFNYQFAVTPTIDLFNNALSLHALFDGQFGALGTDERDAGVRYGNSYMIRCYCDPVFAAQFQYGDNRSQGLADRGFVKFREIGARYQLPGALIERIGADRAALTFSGRELGIWRKERELWGAGMLDDPEKTDSYRAIPALTRWSAELNVTF